MLVDDTFQNIAVAQKDGYPCCFVSARAGFVYEDFAGSLMDYSQSSLPLPTDTVGQQQQQSPDAMLGQRPQQGQQQQQQQQQQEQYPSQQRQRGR
jgi:hypothetical protein